MIHSDLDSLVDIVVVDTDVMSYVFKHDTRAALYERRGRQIQPSDAWIAATALLHEVPLITHNRRDFDSVTGLKVISEASR